MFLIKEVINNQTYQMPGKIFVGGFTFKPY